MKLAHHYRILGLRRNASFSDVKKAYRQLVRKYHPDINPDKAAVERFIKINTAYEALCEALQSTDHSSNNAQNSANSEAPQYVSVETSTSDRLNLDDLKRKLEKLGIGNFHTTPQPSNPATPQNQAKPPTAKTTETSSTHTSSNRNTESASHNHKAESRSHTAETPAKQQHTQTFTNPDSISEQDLSLKQDAYNQLKGLLRQQKFPRAIALVEGLAQRLPTDIEINQWQAIVYQRWGRQLISQGQFQKARIYLKKALQTDPNNPSLKNEVNRDLGLLKHLQAAEATL